MTTENTETEAATAKKSSKKTTATNVKPSASSADALSELAKKYALETDAPFVMINPKHIHMPHFDSRAQDGVLDVQFLQSLKADGVLAPVLLAPLSERDKDGNEQYMVVDGRRRVRGSIEVKLKEIPAYVRAMTDKDARVYALQANLNRQGLTAWDLAMTFKSLKDEGFTQTAIRERIGRSDAFVSQHLAMLEVDPRVQKMIKAGKFEPGTATKIRELKAMKDPDQQYMIAVRATEDENNLWRAEDIAEAVNRVNQKKKDKEEADAKRAKAARKTKAKGEEAEEVAEDNSADTNVYDHGSISLIDYNLCAKALEAQAQKVRKMRLKESVDPVKLAYQRGVLAGFEQFAGFKQLPKGLDTDEE